MSSACSFLLLLLVAVSLFTVGRVSADSTPIQQRIALIPGGMTVSWSTVGPINVTATVAYGTSPTALNRNASGVTLNYNPSTTWFHHVPIYGLAASTTYYWTVISPVGVNSTTLSFTTAQPVGGRTPYNISINGDMGLAVDNGTVQSMQQLLPSINVFWHIGDLSYADDFLFLEQYLPATAGNGAFVNATYESVTETWMTSMTPLWNQKPYMVMPGNHEATCTELAPYNNLCPAGQRNFTSYLTRFRMPANESGAVGAIGAGNMWYEHNHQITVHATQRKGANAAQRNLALIVV